MIENSKLTVVGVGAVGESVACAALVRGSARHIALYDIVATRLGDFHGIDGVAPSVPSIVGSSGARPLRQAPFSTEERGTLRAAALEEVAAGLRG